MRKYAKAVAAILGGAVTAALGVVAPDTTLYQVLTVVAALCTAASVYAVSNTPKPPPGVDVGQYVGK